ncbi:hypothetical protein TPAR_02956, partial [Tolypocladium paradoxum]
VRLICGINDLLSQVSGVLAFLITSSSLVAGAPADLHYRKTSAKPRYTSWWRSWLDSFRPYQSLSLIRQAPQGNSGGPEQGPAREAHRSVSAALFQATQGGDGAAN